MLIGLIVVAVLLVGVAVAIFDRGVVRGSEIRSPVNLPWKWFALFALIAVTVHTVNLNSVAKRYATAIEREWPKDHRH